jgi:isoleucyl-tRNA synthetase
VKRVEFLSSADSLVTLTAKANFRALGKKFGKLTPIAAEAIGRLESHDLRAMQQSGSFSLNVDGREHQIDLDDLTINHQAAGDLVIQEARGYVAALDVTLTPALVEEGLAREVIRGSKPRCGHTRNGSRARSWPACSVWEKQHLTRRGPSTWMAGRCMSP